MNTFRQTSQVLKVLGHPARLQILNALREGEECVCHLTALMRQRQAYVSQQLMFLRQAGLIEDRKDGLRVYYRIKDPRLFQVLDAVIAFVGIPKSGAERQSVIACPCPKCQAQGQRQGRKRWKSKFLVQAVPTVSNSKY